MIYLLCFMFATGTASAQGDKYLISPGQEVIPLGKHSAEQIISRFARNPLNPASNRCPSSTFGFDPVTYRPDWYTLLHNQMVFGQWYVVPADGTIDTVYFVVGAAPAPPPPAYPPGALDSTLLMQIHASNVSSVQGPGIGTYYRGCESWGYYTNTNDPTGMAPFVENATPPNDSAWIPINIPPSGVDPVPSFSPFGHPIWGLQGYPVRHIEPDTVMKVPLGDLGVLQVHGGDVIFISFFNPGPIPYLVTDPYDAVYQVPLSDIQTSYPSRAWKFYPGGSTPPSNCGGVPLAWERDGWYILNVDYPMVYNIWYSMTPTSGVPPVIAHVDQLHTTLSSDPQTFTATIYDCNTANPAIAGIRNAWVRFRVSPSADWTTGLMIRDPGDQFEFPLPGIPPGQTMQYRVVAEDSSGFRDSSAVYSYRVVSLNSPGWYRTDTSSGCPPSKIAATGTPVDTSGWFIAPRDFGGPQVPHPGDDGTAGPFPVSNGFVYFGDTMRYCWIGVNGAIALSKIPTDTIDLNAGGFWTAQWDFPYPQHHGRADTLGEDNMPKAFIAPFWADWVNKVDSPLTTYGSVRYLDDSDRFIVEWDSLGYSPFQSGGHSADAEVFRVVLDKTDYSVGFQYDEIGFPYSAALDLAGIQCDSNYHPVSPGQDPPYAFFNKDGFPLQTQLHNGLCVKYLPSLMTCCVGDGWNLLSVPGFYQDNQRSVLYPTATSSAFVFENGYTITPNLPNGYGFWLKFSGAQCIDAIGTPVTGPGHCIHVVKGWNIIGPFNFPVPVTGITADPSTGIGPFTPFFWYSPVGGYQFAASLVPCQGYWVHADSDGCLYYSIAPIRKPVSADHQLGSFTKITVSARNVGSQTLYIGPGPLNPDSYPMPPAPPDGSLDARFTSNRMVEMYPAVAERDKRYEYPLTIRANNASLTIGWHHPGGTQEDVSLLLKSSGGNLIAVMNGDGKITLNDAGIVNLIIEVRPGLTIPRVFALGTNYPNPFNPTTRFTVELPRNSQVNVAIYDILGRRIVDLWNGEQSAGYHTLEWDGMTGEGTIAPTGIYFIRMSVPAESFTAARKIMLVK